ncbi:MAG TPA: M48 family metallopeptidase, partial [Leptolinea sp.]
EIPILLTTLVLVGGILVLTTGLTVCVVPVLIVVLVMFSYQMNKDHHRALMTQGVRVPVEAPTGRGDRLDQVGQLVRDCRKALDCEPVDVFIVPGRQVNAYTFGLDSPRTIVLYEPMLQIMDADELCFVIGHEMGHVIFGHTWLNTVIGGMAGMPSTLGAAVLLTFAFRWWNRACEYSADRAGLAACGTPLKGVSALAQLAVGDINSMIELKQALAVIDREDNSIENILSEALSDHPMIAKRIKALQEFAK